MSRYYEKSIHPGVLPSLSVCGTCGAFVDDLDAHDEFHDRLDAGTWGTILGGPEHGDET